MDLENYSVLLTINYMVLAPSALIIVTLITSYCRLGVHFWNWMKNWRCSTFLLLAWFALLLINAVDLFWIIIVFIISIIIIIAIIIIIIIIIVIMIILIIIKQWSNMTRSKSTSPPFLEYRRVLMMKFLLTWSVTLDKLFHSQMDTSSL
jgi:hypothetical protein